MHFIKISALAAVLAFASTAQASSAIVNNECAFPVYLWSVGDSSSEMVTIEPYGTPYTEEYQTRSNGAGISIKISTVLESELVITQFEYTLNGTSLWYDVSNVNGFPFSDDGLALVPSESSCREVTCPAGEGSCHAAYTLPEDNWATAECDSTTDLTMTLCPSPSSTKRDAGPEAVAESAPHAHAQAHANQERSLHGHARRAPRGQMGVRR
ncbi:hypothetical protein MMC34_004110 [Xylographa carneopallida]|nr:hypothetical protein [Xylographa carneopallida]